MRDEDDIRKLVVKLQDAHRDGCTHHTSLTCNYVGGLEDALRWILGEIEESDINLLEDL